MDLDRLTNRLSAVASIAVIAGVIAALGGVFIGIQTLKQAQRTASATLLLRLRDALDDKQYAIITDEIQNHGSSYPLLRDRGGKFRDTDIEKYLGNLSELGILVRYQVIVPEMAYDRFFYDVEKAWCNEDVQRVIRSVRRVDRSAAATSTPMYGSFEKLAKSYLARDAQSCGDLNKN
jgi:hypothetical protein